MYEVVKYVTESGKCPFDDYLLGLKGNSFELDAYKIKYHIELLKRYGYRLPLMNKNYAKFIGNGIYELRPSRHRILYFYSASNGKYVLLHAFLKKTQKTPKKEFELAVEEAKNYERMTKNGL